MGTTENLNDMKILSLIEIEIPYDYKKNQTFLHRIWTAKSVLLLLLPREREREREIFIWDWKMLRFRERERERCWMYYGEFKKKMTVALTKRQRTWFSLVLIGLGFSNDAVLPDLLCFSSLINWRLQSCRWRHVEMLFMYFSTEMALKRAA